MTTDLGSTLREIGDDHGRPMPVSGADLLASGKQVRRRRRVAGLTALSAACAAVFAAAVWLPHHKAVPTATASSVYERLAEATSDLTVGPAQYLLVTSSGIKPSIAWKPDGRTYTTFGTNSRVETWIPQDRSQLWVQRIQAKGPYLFESEADRQRITNLNLRVQVDDILWARGGQWPSHTVGQDAVQEGPLEPEDQNTPNDPTTLLNTVAPIPAEEQKRQMVAQGTYIDRDQYAFTYLTALLMMPEQTAESRSLIYRTLELVAHVAEVREGVTIAGRTGVALTWTGTMSETTVLVDPGDGQVVASTDRPLKPSFPDVDITLVDRTVVNADDVPPLDRNRKKTQELVR